MVEAEPTVGECGSPRRRECWVIYIEHPGGIVRDGWAREPQQWEFLRRARGLACGTWEPLSHTALLEGCLREPTLAQLETWAQQLQEGDPTLTVDIECAGPHLVAVGFCRVRDLCGVCVRFRGPEGAQVWGEELPTVVGLVYQLLSDPSIPKWFHNGQAFDIPYLTYQGFEVQGYVGDTMLLQRYMFPEMGAGLEECAIFYAGLPAWKAMVGTHNDDEKGDAK